jgi:uncharacterized membrane protein
LRRSFLTGLLVIVPSLLSFWLCYAFFNWIDVRLLKLLRGLPVEPMRGTGFVLGLGLVIGIGSFANNFVGRRVVDLYEWVLHKLPVVNQLFPAIRQVAGLVFTEQRTAFEKVVLVEYPRRDSWVLGFLTAEAPGVLQQATGEEKLLSIFVPTTPNPTSGFLLMLPERDVRMLEMSPEEGVKLIISGGLLKPGEGVSAAQEVQAVPPDANKPAGSRSRRA